MFFLLATFWFIRETKSILFWLYLWQLKEYHIGRFLAHFQTDKGKKLIWSKLLFLKIALLFGLFFSIPFLPFLLLFLYILESGKTLKDFLEKKLKKPVLTKKTTLLILFSLILEILFLFFLSVITQNISYFVLRLLIFDILTPVITSAIVLIFQPLVVLGRSQIIRKAKKKRAEFKNLIVIGITGSYGKTSTKEFLATILAEKFGENKVLKTKEHQNSEVGISQCILQDLKPEHQIFVCEMGAYNRGGIKLLCDIAKPKIGILTGINEQHLATFGSQENIIKTKFELIESLPEDGVAIINWDNQFIKLKVKSEKLKVKVKNLKFFSVKEKTDIWAEEIKVEREWVSFKVFSRDGENANFRVNLLGTQNISNILAVACCAKYLGMNLNEISTACQIMKPIVHQMELKKGVNGLNIIDATYSANPDGVMSHLEYLKIWQGKKVIVMPCLIELGRASKEVHRRIGKKIAEVCDLAIITTKERFKEIKEGTIEKGMSRENISFIESPKEIFEIIKRFNGNEDVILLESRVPSQLISLLVG